MAIVKKANRNVAFKAVKVGETAFEAQSTHLTITSNTVYVADETEILPMDLELLEDLSRTADLYIFNHDIA